MVNAAFIQKCPVDAAEIDQPKLANTLDIYDRMTSGNLRRIQDNTTFWGPAYRAIASNGDSIPGRCFQPGAFLFEVHERFVVEPSEKKSLHIGFSEIGESLQSVECNPPKLAPAPALPPRWAFRGSGG
jgi:hypothetical protein